MLLAQGAYGWCLRVVLVQAAMMINQGQARHKLQFLIGDHPLPYGMTVYQAIRQYSGTSPPDGQETDTDSENPMGYANIWVHTHTIW